MFEIIMARIEPDKNVGCRQLAQPTAKPQNGRINDPKLGGFK